MYSNTPVLQSQNRMHRNITPNSFRIASETITLHNASALILFCFLRSVMRDAEFDVR